VGVTAPALRRGDGDDDRAGLAPAFAAARGRLILVALLFALAAIAWWSTAERMRGMDAGPGTDLGTLGWFVGVWVVMMAAMMFPSVSPTVALYSRMAKTRAPLAPLVFAAGYLLTWAAAGVLAYGVSDVGQTLSGALQMGARHGAWCVGCCWALMASLFALGVMSLAWMAFVAALIAAEKTLPWRRVVTFGTAGVLLLLGVLLIVAPDAIPGLTIPGESGPMNGMDRGDRTEPMQMP
jgi:predicted metal-binding membrane protein